MGSSASMPEGRAYPVSYERRTKNECVARTVQTRNMDGAKSLALRGHLRSFL